MSLKSSDRIIIAVYALLVKRKCKKYNIYAIFYADFFTILIYYRVFYDLYKYFCNHAAYVNSNFDLSAR